MREGIPCCGEIVSRWDQWSACSSVNAVVHSHFCTSQEMQQLILPHWTRASQRCKCGHSSMEPLTSVGKVWNYRTASTFLSPKRTWNMHWFIYVFYFYRDKKHPQGCFFFFFYFFFIILLVRAKEKMIRIITESDRFILNSYAGVSDEIISG